MKDICNKCGSTETIQEERGMHNALICAHCKSWIKWVSKRKVFKAAIEQFGEVNQIDMAIEEMAELIQALNKYKRNLKHNIEEEIADVEIMMDQLRVIFDKDLVEKYKIHKKQRLEIQLGMRGVNRE